MILLPLPVVDILLLLLLLLLLLWQLCCCCRPIADIVAVAVTFTVSEFVPGTSVSVVAVAANNLACFIRVTKLKNLFFFQEHAALPPRPRKPGVSPHLLFLSPPSKKMPH